MFHYNLTRIAGTLHEDQCAFVIIYRLCLLIMRNILDRICTGNPNTNFMFNNLIAKIVPFMG